MPAPSTASPVSRERPIRRDVRRRALTITAVATLALGVAIAWGPQALSRLDLPRVRFNEILDVSRSADRPDDAALRARFEQGVMMLHMRQHEYAVIAFHEVLAAVPELPVPQASGPSAQLYWDPSGVGFEAGFAGGGRAVHFDSGSERTYLYPAALPSLSGPERAGRVPFERKIAGLGGERVEQASRIPAVRLTIAGHEWIVAPIEVAENDEAGEAGRVGAALLDQFETVVLDFERMRMFAR